MASQLFAPHYAKPVARKLTEGAALRERPDAASEALAEMDAGEEFKLLDITGAWAWGYRGSDHLVGYIPASALGQAPD